MSNKRLVLMSVLAGAALMAAPASVMAATALGTLSVSANVPGGCSVGASNAIDFADYTGALKEVTGTITVNCTADLAYTVELSGGTTGTRQMTNLDDNTKTLSYELYKDSSRSNVWGGAAYTTNSASALDQPLDPSEPTTGTGLDELHTVYGRMPATATPSVGPYQDSVQVTVVYGP